MKTRLLTCIIVLIMMSISACFTPKPISSTSPEATFWYKPETRYHIVKNKEGKFKYEVECSQISRNKKEGFVISDDQWETFCGKVTDYDFEEGNLYHINAYHSLATTEDGIDASTYKVIKVLKVEKDPSYRFRKKEVITAWVGPKIVEGPCNSPMAGPDCKQKYYQVQFGDKYNKDGKWEELWDIYHGSIEEYQEGYVYLIQYTKLYPAEGDPVIMDGPGHEIKAFKVLKSEQF